MDITHPVVDHQVTITADDARIGGGNEAVLDAGDARLRRRDDALEVAPEELPDLKVPVGLLEG